MDRDGDEPDEPHMEAGEAAAKGMVMLGFLPNIGTTELLVLLALGLLLFGRRLPEVGRSLGKAIVEFKKGVKGVEDEVHEAGEPTRLPGAGKPAIEGVGDARRVSTSDKVEEKVS